MAATRLIPLHLNKGKTIAECLKERTDYTENKEKTDDGKYISSYGCDARTADEEFMLSRREYEQCYRSMGRDDVIAYQIRQSFKPGEITPELANRIGYELAMRFTKGRHAFTVCTHVDRKHIHNHVVFNSVTIDGRRKFRNYFNTTQTIRKISDLLCMENGLSVITPERKKRRQTECGLVSLVDIQKAMQEGKGPGYERWAKVFNIKQMSKSLLFLQEHGIKDYGELVQKTEAMAAKMEGLAERLDNIRSEMNANKELQMHIINYAKSGGTDKEAIAAFKSYPGRKLPKIKEIRAEHERLWQESRKTFFESSELRREMKEYQTPVQGGGQQALKESQGRDLKYLAHNRRECWKMSICRTYALLAKRIYSVKPMPG